VIPHARQSQALPPRSCDQLDDAPLFRGTSISAAFALL
jgi:hypothetical protein